MGVLRRYQSEIYGAYRKAYLKYGLITGACFCLYIVVCLLAGSPLSAPETYGIDAILIIGILLFSYLYRRNIPGGQIYLKELMLLGIGIGVVGAVVYGLFLMVYGAAIDTEFPARCMEAYIANVQNSQNDEQMKFQTIETMRHYTIYHWGLIAMFRLSVFSILAAFISALVFRSGPSPVRPKKEKINK